MIRNEGDWEQLHVTRLVVDMAVTRKHNGRLLLTRKARSLLDQGDWAELFRILLHTYCRRFNWAYSDGYPEIPLIQQGFGFSLYLLHRYGDQWRSPQFYADAFLQAFPDLPEEIGEDEHRFLAPGEQAQTAWELRTRNRFGGLFGLVDWLEDPEGEGGLGSGPLVVGQAVALHGSSGAMGRGVTAPVEMVPNH